MYITKSIAIRTHATSSIRLEQVMRGIKMKMTKRIGTPELAGNAKKPFLSFLR